ncbi:hypothetical protein OG756_41310 [Streptomyces sp. NBC_01310]|nr:hypothetical protein OG756_00075 [Streptomyces sp. NBC_01310]WSJ63843.1 hypothetical protein OG756_41310 [Streptomyces sp. NBC_01310]
MKASRESCRRSARTIRTLLAELAVVADTAALLYLRERLYAVAQ